MTPAYHAIQSTLLSLRSASLRGIHETPLSARSHDVLAPFRPLAKSRASDLTFPTVVNEMTPKKREGAFETSSTEPAGTSFQEVPPPNASLKGLGHMVLPVPAMKDVAPKADDSLQEEATSPTRGEITVHGVVIPPKPRPPSEEGTLFPSRGLTQLIQEECCMSGCIHCVYTIYADDLEAYSSALTSAQAALISAGVDKADWPVEVKGGDARDASRDGWVEREKKRVEEEPDPSMAAFLA